VTKPPRRRRKWLFAAIAISLSLTVALGAIEILLRVAWSPPALMAEFQQKGLYQELPDGSAGLTPGYRGTFQLTPDEPVTTIAIDSLGLRGAEPGDRRAGERRLLVVGDSLVFGYGVDQPETFCAVLQTLVRDSGKDLTVGNGGVSGFNTFESAQRIANLRPTFGPDAVLLCVFLGNDSRENRNRDVAIVGGLRFAGPFARMMRTSARARWMARSRLCLWLEGWLFVNKGDWSLAADYLAAVPNDAMAGFPDDLRQGAGLFLDVIDETTAWPPGAPPVVPRAMADFRAGLERAKAAANGLPLHVVVLPTWSHCTAADHDAELRRLGFDPSSFRRGALQQRLLALCRELGLPALDATPWLEAAGDTRASYLSDKGHLSARGNRIVAENLARELAPLWR